ncbi:thioredoxin reductase [Spiroplasma helicoides]|uniref:Ferredoxin--NADP reductase n=1 Tax=Spiroplasma helicoides TaxID=216938 RepID=A0A1B3SJL6_9MOLU|nr:NAD(P)/FAD-dependent oxidoreductase [Spiroplasma helicoides]AOG60118.1 thioredoxin reductase [Spiroplasma helicoides]
MIKDVLIIGAGPAGLYAWKTAADLGLTATIIESNKKYGGQVTNLYPQKPVRNFPGYNEIKAEDAIHKLYDSILKDESKVNTKFNTTITNIKIIEPIENKELFKNWFEVEFSDKTKQIFKTVLCTIGVGQYKKRRLFENDEKYTNIIYEFKDSNLFKNKKVVIFGGGDSALDWANFIAPIARKVSLVHRRTEFRAKSSSIELAKKQNIELIYPYVFNSYVAEDNYVSSLELKNVENEEHIKLDTDFIIVEFGVQFYGEAFNILEIKKNDNSRICVDYRMSSSIEGFYAAGDACAYEGKSRNILSAFFEAMQAIINIEKVINDRKILNNGW